MAKTDFNKEFKKIYVFVHPVFCFFAEASKGRVDRKGMQQFKSDLGKKIQEIAKDKEAMMVWVYPAVASGFYFARWVDSQSGKRKYGKEDYEAFNKTYSRLRDYAQKTMKGRYVDIGESLINQQLDLKYRLGRLKLAPNAEAFVFGEWRERCVNRAVQELKELFPFQLKKVEVIEKLSLKGGEPYQGDFIRSYRRRLRETMQARRSAARKVRRQKKKQNRKGK